MSNVTPKSIEEKAREICKQFWNTDSDSHIDSSDLKLVLLGIRAGLEKGTDIARKYCYGDTSNVANCIVRELDVAAQQIEVE